MIDPTHSAEISPSVPNEAYSSGHVVAGLPVPKTKRLELFSPDDWEAFVEEWASSLKTQYAFVRRFTGSGDTGIDVGAFETNDWFAGPWDNYQCKHYDHAMHPSDVWLEVGKCIYYSFVSEFTKPRAYRFVAPFGVGTSLTKLLADPAKLKQGLKENWATYCASKITSTKDIPLADDLLIYVDSFPFDIFGAVSPVTLIEQHALTAFHAVRFGGGLPTRATPDSPPSDIQLSESRYIEQLYEIYTEKAGSTVSKSTELDKHPSLKRHFLRQRERFYSAESLRNFARDSVPEGTFEALQNEVLHGVADVCESEHGSGMDRLTETLNQAVTLSFASNPLVTAIQTQDKQGICHQLANQDHLVWLPK